MTSSRDRWEVGARILRYGLTAVIAIILVLQANGFFIDFETLRIEKAGLVAIEKVTPTQAKVTLDSEELSQVRGEITKKLLPGSYLVHVTEPNYLSWSSRVEIVAGQAQVIPVVNLYLTEPEIIEQRTITEQSRPPAKLDQSIVILGNELWLKENGLRQLVTRSSQPILSAARIKKDQLLFQVEATVYVADLDGANIRKILSLGNSSPAQLIVDSVDRLTVVQNDELTTYRIQ